MDKEGKKKLNVIFKAVATIFALLIIVFLQGSDEKEAEADVTFITLNTSDSYQIIFPEEEWMYVDAPEYKSTDYEVADIVLGKYIYGNAPGKAVIKLKDGDSVKVYSVTVKDDEDRALGTRYRQYNISTFNAASIGYGYNALTQQEINAKNLAKPVLDWKTIIESGNLYYEEEEHTSYEAISESGIDSYLSKHSQKEYIKTSISIFGFTIGCKKESMSVSVDQNAKAVSVNEIYCSRSLGCYFIENCRRYSDYLIPEVRNKLYDSSVSPEKFMQEYGTHVIVSGYYGGSFKHNYVFSGYASSNTYKDVYDNIFKYYSANNVADNYSNLINFYNIKEKSFYKKGYGDLFSTMNSYAGYYKTFGEHSVYSLMQEGKLSCDSYTEFMGSHYMSAVENIMESPYISYAYMKKFLTSDLSDDSAVLIGPRDINSLYPVWNLIPQDTKDHIDRRNQFIETYNRLVKQNIK